MFDAKGEARKQAGEAEKAREAAVEEAVQRAQRQMEEGMSEAYRYGAGDVVVVVVIVSYRLREIITLTTVVVTLEPFEGNRLQRVRNTTFVWSPMLPSPPSPLCLESNLRCKSFKIS